MAIDGIGQGGGAPKVGSGPSSVSGPQTEKFELTTEGAESAGSVELLELFARRRARLDATDGRIAPALWIAAESGNIDAARALLRGGASPRLRWDGRSPLDIARARRNARLLALMQMR
jgi:ankyrin repeat protein